MTKLVPRSVLYGNPSRLQPEVSPDGQMISFLAPQNGVLNLWIAPTDNLTQARCITDDRGRGIRSYFWSYLPNTIAFTQDNNGDENEILYKLSTLDGGITKIAGGPNIRVEIVRLDPRQKEWILIGINDRNPSQMDYYKVNLITAEKVLLYKNEKSYSRLIFDHDFQLRAASMDNPNAETDIYFFGEDTQTLEFGFTVPFEETMTTYLLGFGDSHNKILMSESRGRDTGALAELHTETKEVQILAAHPKADIVKIESHPHTRSVEAVQFEHTHKEWVFINQDFKDHFTSLQQQGAGYLHIVSRSLNDDCWILCYSPDNATTQFYFYRKNERQRIFLFDSTPELNHYRLSKMEPMTLKARDGLELVCYLNRPLQPLNTHGPNPMVLVVHGGPWYRYTHDYYPTLQHFSDRGYVVLSVNYRSSTGLGKTTLNSGNQEWAGKMHTDLIDACQWAIDQKIADPQKIAIYGGSYGGYAALVGLTFTPQFFACAVDLVGPSNINTLLETIPPYWEHKINMFKRRIGDFTSKDGQKALYLRSPISRVDAIEKPLLILQGANDPRVKQAESDQIFQAMKEKNIPVSYFIFPDEGHAFVRPENKIASMALVEKFLAENLGGRLEDIQNEVAQSSALRQ